ncbi:hypothetical protein PG990_003380 [Apiospora arundinis]
MMTFVFVSTFLLALAVVAVYALVESSRLSLPVSLGLAILTVLLPFTAWASVFGPQVFRRLTSSCSKSSGVGGLLQHPFVLFVLQVLQGIASVVIATLWSQGFMGSGQAVDCNLQTTWRGFWMAHDGRSIESIQNAFGCCGFKSVRDMAWPSPHGNVGLCSELTHRGTSCAAPWRGTLRRLSGFEFGVALGCAAIQFFYLARTLFRVFREATKNISRRNGNNNAGVLEQGPEASLVRRTTGRGAEGNSRSYRTIGGQNYAAATQDADPEAVDDDAGEDLDGGAAARLLRDNNNSDR